MLAGGTKRKAPQNDYWAVDMQKEREAQSYEWEQLFKGKHQMPTPRAFASYAVDASRSTLFVCGGTNRGQDIPVSQSFSISGQNGRPHITQGVLPAIQAAAGSGGAAASVGSKFYVIGGEVQNEVCDVLPHSFSMAYTHTRLCAKIVRKQSVCYLQINVRTSNEINLVSWYMFLP